MQQGFEGLLMSRQQTQDAYALGRFDRARKKPKTQCPYAESNLKQWWLKGWNDKNKESEE